MKARCANCYRAKVIFRTLRHRGNKRFAAAWQEIRHRHTKTEQCKKPTLNILKAHKFLGSYQTSSISPGEDTIVLYLGEGEIHRASDRGKGLIS